jgi:hypothetical protein
MPSRDEKRLPHKAAQESESAIPLLSPPNQRREASGTSGVPRTAAFPQKGCSLGNVCRYDPAAVREAAGAAWAYVAPSRVSSGGPFARRQLPPDELQDPVRLTADSLESLTAVLHGVPGKEYRKPYHAEKIAHSRRRCAD